VNAADYVILIGTMVGIAAYAIWSTRGHHDLSVYLKGAGNTGWLTIGLSVMATQASAITFLSTPGQGYENGLGFVQNYFGAPIALIVIAAVFLPIYRRLKVFTAYEYLGHRFDPKTRLLGACLFLLQRGLGAGITIYAPAIVLSTVMGWRLDVTIVCSGLLVVVYTVAGGCDAVSLTQKYQIGVIFAGMVAAFIVLLTKLPPGLTFTDTLALAGGFHRLDAVDFSLNADKRYTFWTGMLGGTFLALSYFGTDQSQVQRYLGGASLRESRLGLMFNALFKVPMQFFILLLGVLIFVFYQFERPPVFFNRAAWDYQVAHGSADRLHALEGGFNRAHAEERRDLENWIGARRAGDKAAEAAARESATQAHARAEDARAETSKALRAANPRGSANDDDYVFITFILGYLPHGLIGLLVTAFFAAALSSKAGELNALGSTTTVDIYRHLVRGDAGDDHYVAASRWFTAMWGVVAIAFALFANLAENLIQAVNILGSVFYGVVLGLFLVAFFLRWVGGTAVFWGAIAAQALVFVLYADLQISYLWYNVIGCAACMAFSIILQAVVGFGGGPRKAAAP
jgi:SSS family solute:Na+ symporter